MSQIYSKIAEYQAQLQIKNDKKESPPFLTETLGVIYLIVLTRFLVFDREALKAERRLRYGSSCFHRKAEHRCR